MTSWNCSCCHADTDHDAVAVLPMFPATTILEENQTSVVKQASPPPSDPLPMYTVTLTKMQDESFGTSFDVTDPNRPVIVGISPDSALGRYISSASSSSRCPKIGSALVAVDGKAGTATDMGNALRAGRLVSATFKDPRIRTVKIPEGEGSLGLETLHSGALGLFVKSSEGRAASAGVRARDYIIAVNGVTLQGSKYDNVFFFRARELEVWSYDEEARKRTVTILKGDGALGLELIPLTAGVDVGLQVINATGRAAEAGIRSMDIIVAVNGLVKSPEDLLEDLRQPCELQLYVSSPAS